MSSPNSGDKKEEKIGRLKAIWLKRMKRGPMDAVDKAEMVTARGIVGNANQGGRRQVTIIEAEIWQHLMNNLNSNLDPATRRANLMVSGISLANSGGKILAIGECQIRIFGETKPCERMDEALWGLRAAMKKDWGGGAFGEVIKGGQFEIDDEVFWISD